MATKEEKIIIDGAEYDPSLTQFLIDNGYDHGALVPLIPFNDSWVLCDHPSKLEWMMSKINKNKQPGCIFTLPAKGFFPDDPPERADWIVVVFAPISSDEIRRRVALKAFL